MENQQLEEKHQVRYRSHEPVLGAPETHWYQVLWYRVCLMFFVDMISPAFLLFIVASLFLYILLGHLSEMLGLGIELLWLITALNWTTRKYVGPLVEAICSFISGKKEIPSPKTISKEIHITDKTDES